MLSSIRSIALTCLLALSASPPTSAEQKPDAGTLLDALSFENKGAAFQSALTEIRTMGRLQEPEVISPALLELSRAVSVEEMFERIERRLRVDARDDMEFFIRSVLFFRAAALHGEKPVYRDDGIWNLNPVTNFMQTNLQCGEINRLLIDYFTYAGFEARLAQLTQHQAGEVWVDGRWRYADADMLDFSQFPRDQTGDIVGVAEMNADPRILDRLIPYAEATWRDMALGKRLGGGRYPGWVARPNQAMLDRRKQGGDARPLPPYYYDRRMARADWQADVDHGWRSVRRVAYDWKKGTSQSPWKQRFRPAIPWISTIREDGKGGVEVTWKPSFDADKDLSGYRVFASPTPRGWNYPAWNGRETLSGHWSGPGGGYAWPDYAKVDLRRIGIEIATTQDTSYTFSGTEWCGREIFVSVTAIDAWGEKIGDAVYLPSSEFRIRIPACS